MGFFLLATGLSAFLLFQVQPIIARYVLPTFGGSPAVWTACLSFFQAALLLGYLYAHLQVRYVPAPRQPLLHIALLLLSLVLLPITIPDAPTAQAGHDPALDILLLLSVSIGVPFMLVAATAPLLQHWYASVFPQRSPFRLYALSNFGSLLALLSYPVLVEPSFRLDTQALTWSCLYVVLIASFFFCGRAFLHADPVSIEPGGAAVRTVTASRFDRLLWILLAACGTTLLLAITNQLSLNVGAVPFLWILPLSLYLLTFIICFDKDAWYKRALWWPLTALALIMLILHMQDNFGMADTGFGTEAAIYSFVLFTGCMVCHGELARRRSTVAQLTRFYLYIAFGGALGGAFVNFAAPVLFSGYWEFHISLVAVVLLAAICWWQDPQRSRRVSLTLAAGTIWIMALLGLPYALLLQVQEDQEDAIHVARSFFGVIHVDEYNANSASHQRILYHGNIIHGLQLMYPARQKLTTTYYGATSGVAEAIKRHPKRHADEPTGQPLHVGAIGLGAGTLVMHARSGERVRFYEIDPLVEPIARDYFRYLEIASADIDVVLGDARVTLQRELDNTGSQRFDVLAIDAFSGDSIPIHLLTREAFELYDRHLNEGGIIALHFTSDYLDLRPVLRAAAADLRMASVLLVDPARRWYEHHNDWVLMSRDVSLIESFTALAKAKPLADAGSAENIRWTDDFSNLYQVINWKD